MQQRLDCDDIPGLQLHIGEDSWIEDVAFLNGELLVKREHRRRDQRCHDLHRAGGRQRRVGVAGVDFKPGREVNDKRSRSADRPAPGGQDHILLLGLPAGERWAVQIKRGLAPGLEKGFHHARAVLNPQRSFVVYSGHDRFYLAGSRLR